MVAKSSITKEGRVMTYKILVPVEEMQFAKAQIDFLCKQKIAAEAEIILLAVIVPVSVQDFGYAYPHNYFGDLMVAQEKLAENLLQETSNELKRHYPNIAAVKRLEFGNPAQQILDLAKQEKVDWIVIGSHGRSGLEKFFLGSVSQSVVNRASCSVTVVRIEKKEQKSKEEEKELASKG